MMIIDDEAVLVLLLGFHCFLCPSVCNTEIFVAATCRRRRFF